MNGPNIWKKNLIPFYPRMLYANLGCHWLSGSKKIYFLIFLFRYYLLFGKGRIPSLKQFWIPSIQGCFVSSLVEIGSVVLKKTKMLIVTYGKTDRQRTTDDQKSSLALSAQISLKEYKNTTKKIIDRREISYSYLQF